MLTFTSQIYHRHTITAQRTTNFGGVTAGRAYQGLSECIKKSHTYTPWSDGLVSVAEGQRLYVDFDIQYPILVSVVYFCE